MAKTLEEQRQWKREYMRKWTAKNKEHLKEYRRKQKEEHPEKYKEYYQNHKEQIYAYNTKWRKNHKKQFTKLVSDARRRRVERLREQGCINAWSVVTKGDEPKFKNEVE